MVLALTKQQFVEKSKNIYGDKYDYSLVEYVNTITKIKIVCPIHGIFQQAPRNHLNGGCKKCRNDNFKKDKNSFIIDSIKIHNDKYDYSLVQYINAHTNVKIICKKHGVFEQLPTIHLQSCGCPKCGSTYSKGEEVIEKWLITNNINYKSQYKFNNCKNIRTLPFDFYLPDHNICIEFDGIYHYEPIREMKNLIGTKIRDNIKNQFCIDNNIQLVRIPYWNYKKIEEILTIMINS